MKFTHFFIFTSLLCGPIWGQTIKELTSGKSSSKNKTAKTKSTKKVSPSLFLPTTKRHSVGIGLGQTFIEGDFANHGDDSITWDLIYQFNASHSFDFYSSFHYSKHEFKQEELSIWGLAVGIKGKLYHFDNFTPFALGGVGFYGPSATRFVDGVLTETESKTVFGTHFGAGTDLKLTEHFTTGILLQLHNPFDIRQEVGPEFEGSYVKLLVTGLYTF